MTIESDSARRKRPSYKSEGTARAFETTGVVQS
jgi:hypothetical protein